MSRKNSNSHWACGIINDLGTKLFCCWAFGKSLVLLALIILMAYEGIGFSVLLSQFFQAWRLGGELFGLSKDLPGVSDLT